MNPISRFLMRRATLRAARGERQPIRDWTPKHPLPPWPSSRVQIEPEACIPLEPWPVIDPGMLETKEPR